MKKQTQKTIQFLKRRNIKNLAKRTKRKERNKHLRLQQEKYWRQVRRMGGFAPMPTNIMPDPVVGDKPTAVVDDITDGVKQIQDTETIKL